MCPLSRCIQGPCLISGTVSQFREHVVGSQNVGLTMCTPLVIEHLEHSTSIPKHDMKQRLWTDIELLFHRQPLHALRLIYNRVCRQDKLCYLFAATVQPAPVIV